MNFLLFTAMETDIDKFIILILISNAQGTLVGTEHAYDTSEEQEIEF